MKHTITISATEMHQRRGELLRRCVKDGEHIIVEKDGIPVVVLIPFHDYDLHAKC